MKKLYFFILAIMLVIACSTKNKTKSILILGDSNGAHEKGWVYHLQQLVEADTLVNFSISGNTIGYDNLGRSALNTLKNIDSILSISDSAFNNIETVLILLGTNDCKAVYQDSLDKTIENMDQLIKKIKNYQFLHNSTPDIILITPPPYGSKSELIEKYTGGDSRVQKLIPEFKNIAVRNQTGFIDIYTPLKPEFDSITVDGVHLTQGGYTLIAEMIQNYLIENFQYKSK